MLGIYSRFPGISVAKMRGQCSEWPHLSSQGFSPPIQKQLHLNENDFGFVSWKPDFGPSSAINFLRN